MELTFKYTTVEFYKLIRVIESCRPELAVVFQEIESLKDQIENGKDLKIEVLNQFLEGFLRAIIQSEEPCYELLASSTGKTVNEIKALKPGAFLKALKGFFDVIEWEEIVGEIIALIPEGSIKEKIKAYQAEIKEKLNEQISNKSNMTSTD